MFQNRLAPRYADVREKSGLISSRLTNNLTRIATIKSFTGEAYERDRVLAESDAYRRRNGKAIALSAAFFPVIRFAIVAGFIATLFFGGVAAINSNLFGTGDGAGIALLFVFCSICMLLIGIIGYTLPNLQNLERNLHDRDAASILTQD